MTIYNNIDPTSVAMMGVYSESYVSATDGENIASEYETYGLLDVPPTVVKIPAEEIGGRPRVRTGTTPW